MQIIDLKLTFLLNLFGYKLGIWLLKFSIEIVEIVDVETIEICEAEMQKSEKRRKKKGNQTKQKKINNA